MDKDVGRGRGCGCGCGCGRAGQARSLLTAPLPLSPASVTGAPIAHGSRALQWMKHASMRDEMRDGHVTGTQKQHRENKTHSVMSCQAVVTGRWTPQVGLHLHLHLHLRLVLVPDPHAASTPDEEETQRNISNILSCSHTAPAGTGHTRLQNETAHVCCLVLPNFSPVLCNNRIISDDDQKKRNTNVSYHPTGSRSRTKPASQREHADLTQGSPRQTQSAPQPQQPGGRVRPRRPLRAKQLSHCLSRPQWSCRSVGLARGEEAERHDAGPGSPVGALSTCHLAPTDLAEDDVVLTKQAIVMEN
ncbi:hypothetical protein IWX90DRAFT_148019 [Phyllosticta citrichinensis]|uniref:Uncharacterized protein n=1 Tax=Phyllosticta citrichinensis TaxID=1130410 RepID=A0ABR1XZ94_9PEZI